MKKSEAIHWALEKLAFPVLSTKQELKECYHKLASVSHPDKGGETLKMSEINQAYEILKSYMEDFKFTFSDEEIAKQFPQELHVNQFRF